jgi:hypothetical protein
MPTYEGSTRHTDIHVDRSRAGDPTRPRPHPGPTPTTAPPVPKPQPHRVWPSPANHLVGHVYTQVRGQTRHTPLGIRCHIPSHLGFCGRGGDRTPDLCLVRAALLPAELRARESVRLPLAGGGLTAIPRTARDHPRSAACIELRSCSARSRPWRSLWQVVTGRRPKARLT